jgi:Mg-chelatase subunit ChlD
VIRFLQIIWLAGLVVPLAWLLLARRSLRRRPLPDRLAALLRMIALALLLLALAEPQLLSRAEVHYVYFLVDRSASTEAALSEADLIHQLQRWAVPQANTQYGLILFGKDAYVETSFRPTLELDGIYTRVDGEGTDLAGALELALSSFPPDGTKTVLVWSDGRSTEGDLASALARAARAGVSIFTVPLAFASSEFSVQALRAPREVAVELPFSIQAVIYASRPSQARLFFYRNRTEIASREVALHGGLNFIEERDELATPGIYEYRVELVVAGDTLPQNNAYRALVEAVGDPRILVVTDDAQAGPSPLEKLLQAGGYAYARAPLSELAPTPAALLPYRAVILDDVPLRELTRPQIARLERYVRDLGGGLWVLQGRRAVEEFYDREFERLLPVTYEGPEEIQRPEIALVLVLDRSGSMGESTGTRMLSRKIDLLKQAAVKAVERLEDRNLVGIIAFDARYEWVSPLAPVGGRKSGIYQEIQELSPNGGTDLYPALEDAIAELREVRARVKHILVFSDGKVARDRRSFDRLFREIGETQISASSIAIGSQADFEILWQLADIGRGARYAVQDARDLPEITLEELVRLERARWIKGPVPVEPGPYSFELQGVNPEDVPPVGGYVLTFEKTTAQTLLNVQAGDFQPDPLVSGWRYGLGEVLVLNTSLRDEGGERWLDWDGLNDLITQLLGRVYSESAIQPEELAVSPRVEGSQLLVTVEAEGDGRWLDGLDLEGSLSPPEGEARPLEFRQIAPGRYQATVGDLAEGVYLLSVGEPSLGQAKTALSVPYPAEYERVGVDLEALMKIAETTGGRYLEALDDLPALLEGRAWTYRDVWQPLALLALLFFVADLAARKLPLPRS